MAAAKKGVIYVDSNSEDEEIQPMQLLGSRSRRRSRQNAGTKKHKSSKRQKNSQIVIDDVYDSFSESDSSFTKLPLSSEELRSNVLSVSATDNAGPLRTTDVLLIKNDIPADSHPRKTAKRGLARKHSEPQTNDSTSLIKHKVSVYSQAISEGFKSLIHGVGSGGPEAAVDDSENVLTETKEIDAELPSTHMGSRLTENQEVFSQLDQTNLEEDADVMVNSVKIQSPSPPPKLLAKPAKRMNKKLTLAFNALSKAKDFLDSTTPPNKRCKRRDSDVIIVGEEAGNKDIVVKVRYLTKVHRFQLKLNEPFHILTKKLSKEINEDEHSLGLFLNDESLKVTETPQSVKLSVADIIECHCIKVSENSAVSSSDAIELVIQCSNSRSKTTLIANRRRPLSDIMQTYAQLMNDVIGSYVFSFDGEDIEPSDTPSKLDMEDHDVIDVVHN